MRGKAAGCALLAFGLALTGCSNPAGDEDGFLGSHDRSLKAEGMARRPTRRKPAQVNGNGRGIESRQGAIRVFWEDADRQMLSGAHGNNPPRSPDARSGEPSAHSTIEVSGTLSGR